MTLPIDTLTAVMRALDFLSQGHTLSAACDKASISVSAFNKTVRNTKELHDLFTDAEQRGYDRMADTLLTMDAVDNVNSPYYQTDPKIMKILSDNIKWYLSRKRPQQYGERVIVENTITADRAIIDALERAKQRAIGAVVEDVAYALVQDVPALPSPQKNPVDVVYVNGVELDAELADLL